MVYDTQGRTITLWWVPTKLFITFVVLLGCKPYGAAHMIPAMTKKTAHKQELGRTATQAFIIMCSDRVAMIKLRGGGGVGGRVGGRTNFTAVDTG